MEREKKIRVAVLVSGDPSDIYFANYLAKKLNVVGVLVENQRAVLPGKTARLAKLISYGANPRRLIKKVKDELRMRSSAKKVEDIVDSGFGEEGARLMLGPDVVVRYTTGVNDINEADNVEFIKGLCPDVIALCGVSIVKDAILAIAPKGTCNLHGGLAQWYRGVWTTMWAIYNDMPQLVGATVHYVSKGIDDGDIIYQGRPIIEAEDNHETLYVKVVRLGVKLMVRAINEIEAGTIVSHPLTRKGKLYLQKKVTPEVIAATWKKVEDGLIRDYVKKVSDVDNGDEILIEGSLMGKNI